jgi:hypothetical protein
MYVPITSSITIEPGLMLKEIKTDRIFSVEERVQNGKGEVLGQDLWRIISIVAGRQDGTSVVIARQDLSERFFAEVDG